MKTAYGELLRDPRWQKKRLIIFERDKFTCRNCSDADRTLHAHHRYYVKGRMPWEYPDDAIVTLCEACHAKVDPTDADSWEYFLSIYEPSIWARENHIELLAFTVNEMLLCAMPEWYHTTENPVLKIIEEAARLAKEDAERRAKQEGGAP